MSDPEGEESSEADTERVASADGDKPTLPLPLAVPVFPCNNTEAVTLGEAGCCVKETRGVDVSPPVTVVNGDIEIPSLAEVEGEDT